MKSKKIFLNLFFLIIILLIIEIFSSIVIFINENKLTSLLSPFKKTVKSFNKKPVKVNIVINKTNITICEMIEPNNEPNFIQALLIGFKILLTVKETNRKKMEKINKKYKVVFLNIKK